MLKASSSVMVLPTSRAPASSSAFTAGAVAVAGGWVASQVGIAGPRGVPRHVEQVLGREGQAGERPLGGARHVQIDVRAEGAKPASRPCPVPSSLVQHRRSRSFAMVSYDTGY